MGNCHDCSSFLTKTELALGFPEPTEESYIVSETTKNYSHFSKVLPKLIALWRAHTERKQFMHIYKQSKPEYSYFDIDEIKETLSTSIGMAKFKEKRSEYKFKKGRYTGEWCGGFRHGFGTMEWKDGCKYEGLWKYSRPSGTGKFIYKNGEGYSGDWKVYYVFSKAIFKTGRLEQWKDCVQDGYCKG